MKIKANDIATHLTALATTATTVLALVHPGFKVPSVAEGLIASVGIIVTGALEAYHLLTKRQFQAAIATIAATSKKVEADVTAPAAPSAPQA